MGKLFEIASMNNEQMRENFNRDLSKAIDKIARENGIPFKIVLEKAIEKVNERAKPFEINISIPVLDKNDSWKEHRDLVCDEAAELMAGIAFEDTANILEESLDVIQVCVGILAKVEESNPGTVNKAIQKHMAKLVNRGWKFKKILKVTEV